MSATPEPLLSVRDLRVAFSQGGGWVPVVDGLSFDIARSECFALVGESGSGKSITALSILRLLPQGGYIQGGQALLDGTDLFAHSERTMESVRGRRIGIIFQDPMSSLNPVLTLGRQIGETLALQHRLKGQRLRRRAMELFDQVGLPHPARHLDEYPHQLSGGMRQRAMIALALAGEPALLIADEPTTALDVTLQAQVLELLNRLRRETGMALWLITHDFGIVAEIADRIAVMRAGRLVESSGPEFFEGPCEEYSRALLAAMPRLDACLEREANAGCSPEPSDGVISPLLDVSDFRVHYPIKKGILQRTVDHVRAVDGVSFSLGRGETLALVGESGCGKTTLGKGLLGLVPSSGGGVRLNGEMVIGQRHKQNHHTSRNEIQIVFQDPYSSMNPRMVVGDIVAEGLLAQSPRLSATQRQEKVESLLLAVGLPAATRLRYPHEFSGGQRQRICIARALAVDPQLVICDEPTSALDVSVQAQVIALLRDLQRRHGLSYLFITHDLALVSELANRVAVMQAGKIIEQGPVRQVLLQPQQDYTRRLLAALPKLRQGRKA